MANEVQNAADIAAWERRNTSAMRIIYTSIKEEKSRPLMSCSVAQEMWEKMETAYSEAATDSAPQLWSRFYGCKFQSGQTVMEFMSEVEHIVSRLRAIDGIVLLDDQIIAKVIMSVPPSLKLFFEAAWESTAASERTLRNLTTRLVKLEKEVKQSEERNASEALISKKTETTQQRPATSDDSHSAKDKNLRECWECEDTSHIRANCRDYKRRLRRQREEEDEDRDRKRRRWDRDDNDRSRRDDDDKQYRSGRDRDNNNCDRSKRERISL